MLGDEGGIAGPMLLLGIILPTLVLGLLLLALGAIRPPVALPLAPALRSEQENRAGPALTEPESGSTVQELAQDLERAIGAVKEGGWRIDDGLSRLREKLVAERSALQGMQTLLEEMKRDADARAGQYPPSGNLEIEYGALERSYRGWEASRSERQAVAGELEAALALVQEQTSRVQQASQRLEEALQQTRVAPLLRPMPGDEEGPLVAYQAAARIALQELASARTADAEYLKAANELLGQGKAMADAARRASQASRRPQFRMGFKLLADQIPTIAGEPVEEEHPDAVTGDMLQRTTRGMMVWRKADNWTGFTNGAQTWYLTPSGVQLQPNSQR